MNIISIINFTSVGIFGLALSAGFCDIHWTRQKKLFMAGCICIIMLFQGVVLFSTDIDTIRCFYPLITHIPMSVALCILNMEFVWSLIAVLTAYLCCQIRKWLALLVVSIFSGGALMQNTIEFIVTLPLFLLLLRFVAPSVRSISHYTTTEKYLFGLVPLLYYGYDYLTIFFTNLISGGNPVVVEFMPFVCSVTYLIFVLRVSEDKRIHIQMEQTQGILNLQVTQAVREIAVLRESYQKSSTYRHDLRHHMLYLLSCIENGRVTQAQTYIQEVCSEIEAAKVIVFCENEAANLIFSAFSVRAKNSGVTIHIKAAIPQDIPIPESDWCVLLSNALENALHACQKLQKKGLPTSIEISAYEKNGKMFLQVANSCDEEISFSHGVPVTTNPGHGIGVHSICTIIERYNGIYSFSAENGQFLLRLSL